MPRLPTNAPTLRDFLQRSKTVRLYRDFLRAVRPLERAARAEVVRHVRSEFRKPLGDGDRKARLRDRMIQGAQELEALKRFVLTTTSASSARPGAPAQPGGGSGPHEASESDVGSGWPWERR